MSHRLHSLSQYRKEGIKWETIDYFNNKIICDMVEEKHKGIVAILVSLPDMKIKLPLIITGRGVPAPRQCRRPDRPQASRRAVPEARALFEVRIW